MRPSINETPVREPPKHTHNGVPSMDEQQSLNHSKWECKYHVVFIPKYRRKTLYVGLRRHLGEVFRKLAEQKESRIEEGHLLVDHVHNFDPTKIRSVAGDRVYQGKECNTLGSRIRREEAELRRSALLGEGIFVSTVGRDTEVIRDYIKRQEEEDKRLEQMNLWR